jgi:signal transduction histidine kinase
LDTGTRRGFSFPEPTPEIDINCEIRGEVVQIRIADNGPGIPDDRKERIFGKGEKGLDSAGTGIGLYLVRTLVNRYGGRVWVEDNDPKGAVFIVELPTA